MKVIRIDNHDRDYYPSQQITLSVSEEMAEAIAKTLNERAGENGDDYYKVVADDYTPCYADLDTANGDTKTFKAFVAQRGYSALPLPAQLALYSEYLEKEGE